MEDISAVEFLRDRLSLYGGTVLTFIYSQEILRLSIDLDLNYRHLDPKDWGEVRDEIDERIKDLLYRQGYQKTDLAINASYPLARITVRYTSVQGLKDTFKIEIGYMRRYPILQQDTLATFKHLCTQETFLVKTPVKEELFANKWCALLYRQSSRDLFDVYRITQMKLDRQIFRKCAVVDSLMRGEPKLPEIPIEETIQGITVDSSLKNLLQTEKPFDFEEMKRQVIKFSNSIISQLTKDEVKAIHHFYQQKTFHPELIDKQGRLHPKITKHPSIQWTLTKPE